MAIIWGMTRAIFGLAALVLMAPMAPAQTAYPTKPVKLLVPAAPGGNPDILARVLAQKLTAALGNSFFVENLPGAGGVVAAQATAKAPPDGYVLFLGDSGSLAISVATTPGLTYDPLKDFTPISALASVPTVLVINPELGIKDLPAFIAAAKQSPKKFNYGSPGIGSVHHLTMAVFAAQMKIDLEHVAYRGGTPMVDALLRREVQAGWSGIPNVMEPMRLGTLRGIAVSTAKRQPATPDIPTLAELGYGNFDIATMIGLLGPAGLAKPIVDKLQDAVAVVLRDPEMVSRLDSLGMTIGEQGSDAYAKFMKADVEKYAKAARDAGLSK
ncbi:tripartite tricarboxylate transporter substrate binding protein [Roseiarcaceae bacterium H3SJ34-1]|uniref:Bug family tripartite tricarboxylate transporter substrate binding protein n=1 Tax=Terripilifer ovatus TaxID=3032367 RepID=UPI003AB9B7C3|nr:tripartite tricarboxylate transporter substrate binding protein [Roseiarcaceae bacterium H3SJ34-1]